MRSIIAIAAVAVVASIAALPAAAITPTQTTQTISLSYTDTWSCGFPIDTTTNVGIVTTTFYDNVGTPVRTFTVNRAEGTMIAETTGRVLHFDQAMNVTYDLLTNVSTSAGETSRFTGDDGVVLLRVGRVVWQYNWPDPPTMVSSNGQDPQGFTQATYNSIVCPYFAGA
jgi:hypothetical protein